MLRDARVRDVEIRVPRRVGADPVRHRTALGTEHVDDAVGASGCAELLPIGRFGGIGGWMPRRGVRGPGHRRIVGDGEGVPDQEVIPQHGQSACELGVLHEQVDPDAGHGQDESLWRGG